MKQKFFLVALHAMALFLASQSMAGYQSEWFEPAKTAWNAGSPADPYNFNWWSYTFPGGADHTPGSPPDAPFTPQEWMEMAGMGMSMKIDLDGDLDGSSEYVYTDATIQAWKAQGFRAGRLHVNPLTMWDLAADADGLVLKQSTLDDLEATVQRFVDNGMPVLISLSAGSFKADPMESYADTENYRDLNFTRICEWYRQMAEQLKDVSHLLAFESFIEYHGFTEELEEKDFNVVVNNGEVRYPDYANYQQGQTIDDKVYRPGMNNLYVELSKVIRETNPTRIVCYRPAGQGRTSLAQITPWRWGGEGDPLGLANTNTPYWVMSVGGSANMKKDYIAGVRAGDPGLIADARNNTWGAAVDYYNGTQIPIWISLWGPRIADGTDLTPPITDQEHLDYVNWYIEGTQTEAVKPSGERSRVPNGFQQSWWLWDFDNDQWFTTPQGNLNDPIAIRDTLSAATWTTNSANSDWPPMFLADPIMEIDAFTDTTYNSTLVGDCAYDKGDVLTYSKVSGPGWLSVATNGTLSGTPLTSDLGPNSFVVGISSPLGTDQVGLELLVAVGQLPTYTLTYSANANGSISGTTPQTISQGSDGSAVTADADSGYHFVNWSDSSTVNPRTDTSVSADVTVTANFAVDTTVVSLARYDFDGGNMVSIDTDVHSTASAVTPHSKQDTAIGTVNSTLGTGNNLLPDDGPIMEFTVSAAVDHELELDSLTYDWLARASSADTHTTRVFSSLDGYAVEIASASLSPSTESDPKIATMMVDLSGVQFQGLSNVTFRVMHEISANSARDFGAILSSKSHGDFLGLTGLSAGTYQDVDLQGESVSTLTPESLYSDWTALYPTLGSATNHLDNPDDDALNNLGEYALGGNLTNGADIGYVPEAVVTADGGTNYFEYIYAKRNDSGARGLIYSLELTTNLVSNVWTNGTVDVVGIGTLDAEFDSVTNRVPTVAGQEFIRLRIEFQ